MTSKHTPGPWYLDYSGFGYTRVLGQAGKIVADPVQQNITSVEELRSNANLIASAPELLEALEYVQAFAIGLETTGHPHAKTLYDKATDAINKAKGKK